MTPEGGPVRSCIACRRRCAPDELIRLSADDGGGVCTSAPGAGGHRGSGRGAYVCADVRCCMKALSAGRLARALRCEPSASAVAALQNELEAIVRRGHPRRGAAGRLAEEGSR